MSDQSQGPGWWLASDGKWYPPDQAPAVPPPETWAVPPAGPPPSGGMSTGAKIAIAVVVGFFGLILISVLAIAVLGTDSESSFEATGSTLDGGDGSDAGTADVPEGYEVIEGDGVSIAAPDHWQEVSADDFAMSEEEFAEAFPDAPESLIEQGANAVDSGAVLVAYDFESERFDNVNILEMGGVPPLDVIEAQARLELEAVGADIVSLDEADVPAGDALRAEYTVTLNAPDGPVDVHGVQYYVVTDDEAFVVTFSGDGAVDVSAEMIETFRLG
jgi:hypothetical protein